ncbi:MAG: hypothetical protein EOO38_21755 [Cytophagaceae bacterium]|nr:MAG: hypothetical protein EOO38_21755 [Cytophagaceae bacterium]
MLRDKECAQEASRLLSERDRRYALFPAEMFDEFAWNMLLHLFVHLANNDVMTEAHLIELSHATRSVGKRWIRHLVADKQIEDRHDGDDVTLTAGAVDRLRRYLRPLTRNVDEIICRDD